MDVRLSGQRSDWRRVLPLLTAAEAEAVEEIYGTAYYAVYGEV